MVGRVTFALTLQKKLVAPLVQKCLNKVRFKSSLGVTIALAPMNSAKLLIAGIRSTGINTLDIVQVATPIVYHASVTNNATPAIMITGSHLPPDRNGFKMTRGLTPFFGEDIQQFATSH